MPSSSSSSSRKRRSKNDLAGEIEGYQYKILGKTTTVERGRAQAVVAVADSTVITRTHLLIKLKESYTTYAGTIKHWAPFYMSSGTYGGTEKGDITPYRGIVLNEGQNPPCKNLYEHIVESVKKEIDSHKDKDYINNQLIHITANCSPYYFKCAPGDNLYYIFYKYLVHGPLEHPFTNYPTDSDDWSKHPFPNPPLPRNEKLLAKDIRAYYNGIYDILQKQGVEPKFHKIEDYEINIMIKNAQTHHDRFLNDTGDRSSKVCTSEYIDIKNIFKKHLKMDLSRVPLKTDQEINNKIGGNNMFGVNLTSIVKGRGVFDYKIWDEYKETIFTQPIGSTLNDIDMYPHMAEILLAVLFKIRRKRRSEFESSHHSSSSERSNTSSKAPSGSKSASKVQSAPKVFDSLRLREEIAAVRLAVRKGDRKIAALLDELQAISVGDLMDRAEANGADEKTLNALARAIGTFEWNAKKEGHFDRSKQKEGVIALIMEQELGWIMPRRDVANIYGSQRKKKKKKKRKRKTKKPNRNSKRKSGRKSRILENKREYEL